MSDIERKHMSEPTPVRRFEVFTGAGRRRRWAAEAKAEIVAESFASSGTVSSVARRHGLTAQQLFAWRRAARQSGAVARSTSAKPKLPAGGTMLVPMLYGCSVIGMLPREVVLVPCRR